MTTQVDFYILQTPSYMDSLAFISKLIQIAYQHQHSLQIACESVILTNLLNQKLWALSAESFLPHQMQQQQIEVRRHYQTQIDTLMLLGCPYPSSVQNWSRILQIVPNQTQPLTQARLNYRQFQQQGYTIHTHKINGKT